ncbi:hypothetical protein Q3G72_020472 [Acer saccharum]|nr:hypothetical protein Q3G72_020472 [Acer saccharum]
MDTSKEVDGGGNNNNNNKQEKHESEAVKGGGGDSIRKGRSCIGYHYFSSSLKSSNGKPRCIGLPRTLQQVPNEAIRSSEAKALEYGGRTILGFYYSCTGYSIYINVQDDVSTDNKQTKMIELPACVGLEHLWDVKVTCGDTGSTPAPAHSKVESLRIQLLSEPISGDTTSALAPAPVHTRSKD